MRHNIGDTVFAVQFTEPDETPGRIKMFYMPLAYLNSTPPTKINIIRMEVMEHHKVAWDQDPTAEKKYDGYLLKDDSGLLFSNQHPLYEGGQLTDKGNRLFYRHGDDKKKLIQELKASPSAIYSYNLLSDVLERMEKGIKTLSAPPAAPEDDLKAKQLIELRDKIIKQFKDTYPEYSIELTMEKLCETSNIEHEICTIKFS